MPQHDGAVKGQRQFAGVLLPNLRGAGGRLHRTIQRGLSPLLERTPGMYSTIFVDSRQTSTDEASIFDPATPQVHVICPECRYDRAVFLITPDENETKLVAKMMCASIAGTVTKCGHTW